MTPSYITVEPAKEGKGRTFTALHLAHIVADQVWDKSGGSNIRPILLVVGGADTTVRPLVANLVLGRTAILDKTAYSRRGDKVELLKTAGYRVSWQRFPGPTGKGGDSVAWIYLPEPLSLDPGMVDPVSVRFALAPPLSRLAERPPASPEDVAHVRRVWDEKTEAKRVKAPEYSRRHIESPLTEDDGLLAAWGPLSTLFCAALDRRTRRPLLDDPAFRLQLFVAAVECGVADCSTNGVVSVDRYSRQLRVRGLEDVGLGPCVAVSATHTTIDELLTTEVRWYMAAKQGVRYDEEAAGDLHRTGTSHGARP